MTSQTKTCPLIELSLEQACCVIQDLKQLNLGVLRFAATLCCISSVTVEHTGKIEGTRVKMRLWSAFRALFSKVHVQVIDKQTLKLVCDTHNARIVKTW